MKIIKTLKLSKVEFYKKHLYIINHVLPVQMTNKEIEVLASFMSLEGSINSDRFGTSARKLVKEELSLSSGGLCNYLNQLKVKGFIKSKIDLDKEELYILPILIPSIDGIQEYYFKLEINE